jgi:hypothetical protein
MLNVINAMMGSRILSSAALVAAWVPDMFCNFYVVKNHKFALKKLNNHYNYRKEAHIWNP